MNQITSYWDKQSEIWREEKEDAWLLPETTYWLEFFQALPMPSAISERKILELGTASGYFANIMALCGYEVTAIDVSPAMISEAGNVSRKQKLTVDYRVMDAQRLTFADDSFDIVFTRLMTWTVPDLLACYREVYRVLKPGGKFINFDGDFGSVVFSQEGHERYPAEIMEEANIIKACLDISKHKRPAYDAVILERAGFRSIESDQQAQSRILKTDERPTGLFMVTATKPD